MGRVDVEIEIAVLPEEVWGVASDVHRLGEWVTVHRGVDRADDGPLRTGFTMVQHLALNGTDFTVDWTAVGVDAPGLLRWEGTGPAGARAVTEYRLAAAGAGTRFTYVTSFDPPGGVLGDVVSSVLMGDLPQEEALASLERLRALLEQPAG